MNTSINRSRSTRLKDGLDAIVVGGGPVALTAALKLMQLGQVVALVVGPDKPATELAAEIDLRVYAMAPDVLDELTQLSVDLASADCVARVAHYTAMHVWQQRSELNFTAAEYGWSALGSIIEHAVLHHALWKALRPSLDTKQLRIYESSAELHSEVASSVQNAAVDAEPVASGEVSEKKLPRWVIETTSASLRAPLVVAADGAQSALRRQAGIGTRSQAYAQNALVLHVAANTLDANAAKTAWQRMDAEGTLAFLPLPERRMSVVWSQSQQAAERRMQLSDAALLAELQIASENKLGTLGDMSKRRSIPLLDQQANAYQKSGFVLVGDSAHCVHPLAGQGLNLGLRDVFCLAKQLQLHSSQARALRAYERERRSENQITSWGIDGIQKMFAPERGPIATLRAMGLSTVERIRPLKRLFAELAAGQIAGWPASKR